MTSRMNGRWFGVVVCVCAMLVFVQCAEAGPGARFRVNFPDPMPMPEAGADGRLIVFVVRDDGPRLELGEMVFSDPQPIYSIAIPNARARMEALVADQADAFPDLPSALPAGRYRAMAVFRRVRANSSWRREPGNLFSDEVRFEVRAGGMGEVRDVRLMLNGIVRDEGVRERRSGLTAVVDVEVDSKILEEAQGAVRRLRARVVAPMRMEPGRKYPAVYVIHGFGGDFREDAAMEARRRTSLARGSVEQRIRQNAYLVFLDGEGPFGHHLFADSANNGPVGRALVEELIPAIEERFAMLGTARGRVVTGHSSGAWSGMWLALTYPEVFGACFVTAPDPIDFRAFQNTDIYREDSMFTDDAGREKPVYRRGGRVLMTVAQENRMERAMGPGAWSAQQWSSWHAVFGARSADGEPVVLFDARTGKIDRSVAEHWRGYDMGAMLRDDPERLLPLWRERVRMVIGTQDAYYLEKPAMMVWETLERLSADRGEPVTGTDGFAPIVFAEGYTHGTVQRSEEAGRLRALLAKWVEGAGE